MAILQLSLRISAASPHNLSSSYWIVPDPTHRFLSSQFTHLSIAKPPKPTPIRMGGGPRTYPGGVSKWQWKRMQAKKAKQLLKARLARQRQIYEMRKRAELQAAITELERPWEVVEKAPKLFSTSADEQVKVLADRFQKPGGFDLWSEKDGPQLIETVDGVPSARFFPKGVVHSIKPYGRITDGGSDEDSLSGLAKKNEQDENSRRRRIETADTGPVDQFSDEDLGLIQGNRQYEDARNGNRRTRNNGSKRRNGTGDMGPGYQRLDENSGPGVVQRNGQYENSRSANGKPRNNDNRRRNGMEDRGQRYQLSVEDSGLSLESGLVRKNRQDENGKFRKNGNRRIGTANMRSDSIRDGLDHRESGRRNFRRGNGRKEGGVLNSEVFDMSLQDDGSYGISK